jgi:hypothetical protein
MMDFGGLRIVGLAMEAADENDNSEYDRVCGECYGRTSF